MPTPGENSTAMSGRLYDMLQRYSMPGLIGSAAQVAPATILEMLRGLAPDTRAPIAAPTTVTAPAPTEAGIADPNLPRPPEFLPPGASVAGGGRPAGGRASPVVTPGTAEGAAPAAPAAPTETTQSPDTANPRDRSMDQLANFGFAMAASRNPSIFGQIGEAGLAMQRGNREDRQDSRQEREVEVMQEYRRAQIRVAEAEAELARDPNSPINVARLMQARAQMLSAQRAGSGGGSGGGGSFVPLENEAGDITFFNPRSGASVNAPAGFGRAGGNGREDALFQRDVAAFTNAARGNMATMNQTPEEVLRGANAYARGEAERRRRGGATPDGTAPPPAAAANRPVYGVDGRPIAR